MIRVVADLGNSRLKWGLVSAEGRLGPTLGLPLADEAAWHAAWNAWNLGQGSAWLISSVVPLVAARLAAFLEAQGVAEVGWCRSVEDVAVRHADLETRTGGADRALNVVGALRLRPGADSGVVIACGTALCVERVECGVWQGGAIAPGLRLVADALHRGTAQLPRIDVGGDGPDPAPVGRATVPSLEAGIVWGAVGAARELAARVAEGLPPGSWRIWTGGDAPRLARLVDGPSAMVVPDLVLEGLLAHAESTDAWGR